MSPRPHALEAGSIKLPAVASKHIHAVIFFSFKIALRKAGLLTDIWRQTRSCGTSAQTIARNAGADVSRADPYDSSPNKAGGPSLPFVKHWRVH